MKTLYATYWLYVIWWETMVWGGSVYLITHYGWSKWWLALAFLMSCAVMRIKNDDPDANKSK
jgi:hypothetical protein